MDFLHHSSASYKKSVLSTIERTFSKYIKTADVESGLYSQKIESMPVGLDNKVFAHAPYTFIRVLCTKI